MSPDFRACRKRAGLSQVDIAKRFGITRAAVSSWERGHTQPHPQIFYSVAMFMKLSVAELESAFRSTGRQRRRPAVGV